MKTTTGKLKVIAAYVLFALAIQGCLIKDVKQPASVAKGGVFETQLTVTDKTADANAHEGIVLILAPDDWTFVSGTYDSQSGTGKFNIDKATSPTYGEIDTTIPPPAGMKWIRLITENAHSNAANAIHEAKIKLQVGTKTGIFKIGYLVTKNTADMLKAINPANDDNDNAWADTSMNHAVTVTTGTGVENNSNVVNEFSLSQNYPNPFNPSTVISFNVPKESHVRLSVYNSLGQQITTLIDRIVPAGEKTVRFNASNINSGIYYYKLEAGSFSVTKKMLLVK
ncbi:MAG: T9SS type A sorting domain-containing protein [Ignavibacteriales bacterium]